MRPGTENRKKNYKDKNLTNAQPVTDNRWYTTESGEQKYLDKELVSGIIAFESGWQAMKDQGREAVLQMVKPDTSLYNEIDDSYETAKGSKLNRLDIGEIKDGGRGIYYMCVREVDANSGTKEKIYKINSNDEKMIFEKYINI